MPSHPRPGAWILEVMVMEGFVGKEEDLVGAVLSNVKPVKMEEDTWEGVWVRRGAVGFWSSCSLRRSVAGQPQTRLHIVRYIADVNVEILCVCGIYCPSQGGKSLIWGFLQVSSFFQSFFGPGSRARIKGVTAIQIALVLTRVS